MHPGNIFEGEDGKSLVFLDCGMVAELSHEDRSCDELSNLQTIGWTSPISGISSHPPCCLVLCNKGGGVVAKPPFSARSLQNNGVCG